MSDNDLSGTIPSVLGYLTHLTSLILDFNKLTGTIPYELGYLTDLQDLSIMYYLLYLKNSRFFSKI